MRVGGLNSGMDIDKLVSDLMKAEKQPLTKMEQDRTRLEWKRDSYREINKSLKELDDLIFEGINKETKLGMKSVTSTDSELVTANASAEAGNITTSIKVHQLATSTTWISNNTSTIDKDFSSFEGKTISLNIVKGDGSKPDPNEDGIPGEPVEIDIKKGDSIEDVLQQLNNNEFLGVSAFYDEVQDKVVITKSETGSNSQINLQDSITADFFKQLGFVDAFSGGELGDVDNDLDGVSDGSSGVKTIGNNADIEINGYRTTRDSNNFTINKVNYQLHAADSTKTVNIQSNSDTDAIYETIKEFVDKYNEVIEDINTKLEEKRYRDFPPLTEDQKKDMEENEIKLWDEKAKSGMLYNDTVLEGSLNSMRIGLYSPIEGLNENFNMLSELGISSSSNYKDNGKLEINEDTLREAIESNQRDVYEVFNKTGNTFETKGIVERLRENIDDTIKQIEKKAGNEFRMPNQYSIGKEMNKADDRIDHFQDRLADIENRYWREFTEMEKIIGKYNSQFSMLMGSSGGGY